jgi:hypothetical protein
VFLRYLDLFQDFKKNTYGSYTRFLSGLSVSLNSLPDRFLVGTLGGLPDGLPDGLLLISHVGSLDPSVLAGGLANRLLDGLLDRYACQRLADAPPEELFVGPLDGLPDRMADRLLVVLLVPSAHQHFCSSAACPTAGRMDYLWAYLSLPLICDLPDSMTDGLLVDLSVPSVRLRLACRLAGWIACRPAR